MAGEAGKIDFGEGLDNDDRGMYGNDDGQSKGGQSILDEWTDADFSDEASMKELLSKGDYTNVYGEDWKQVAEDAGSVDPFINMSDNKAEVLGLPLNFNKLDDPDGRVYMETIMAHLPYIFVVPGRTKLNAKLVKDDGSKVTKGNLLSLIEGDSLDISAIGVKGARTSNDIRFLGFKQAYKEYYQYVNTTLVTLHDTMGLQGIFRFKKEFESTYKHFGLCFYADRGTTISESNSNDYTQSSIAQKANDKSASMREMKTMLGVDSSSNSLIGKALDLVMTGTAALTEAVSSLTGILGRAGNIFGRVVNGSNLLFPDMCNNINTHITEM